MNGEQGIVTGDRFNAVLSRSLNNQFARRAEKNCSQFTVYSSLKKKAAFTLAEVLITLGIIGVVAAMTLPTLINNYQKKVTVNKLKHFSSIMQQAGQMRTKDELNGDFYGLKNEEVQGYNGQDIEKYINIYFKPYLKILEIEVLQKGARMKLANGDGVYIQRTGIGGCSAVGCNMYLIYCPDYRYCKDVDKETNIFKAFNPRHAFAFYVSGNPPNSNSREAAFQRCTKNDAYACSTIIRMDGWEIKDDYPW